MKRVLVSGGFDPLHAGHVDMFAAAKARGDRLIVAVNTDEWLHRKKGYVFMPMEMRMKIVRECRYVDEVIMAETDQYGAISPTIKKVKPDIFANGGDRVEGELPESEVAACEELGVELLYGIGGGKIASSSTFASNLMRREQASRPWGGFEVIRRTPANWVKIIEVDPFQMTSLQRHKHRDESWVVVSGKARITTNGMVFTMQPGDVYVVPRGTLHRIENVIGQPLIIVEVAVGNPQEDDIERRADLYGRRDKEYDT